MSSPEWAASDSTPSEPESRPAPSFSSVIAAAASIECSATRRFSAEYPAILEASEIIALLGYSAARAPCTTPQCQR